MKRYLSVHRQLALRSWNKRQHVSTVCRQAALCLIGKIRRQNQSVYYGILLFDGHVFDCEIIRERSDAAAINAVIQHSEER